MGKAQMRAGIWLAIMLASSVCAFALDPTLDVSQYLWLATEFGWFRFDGLRRGGR